MMTDPIADMLTRIRNAHVRKHPYVEVPQSRLKLRLAEILREEGFVRSVDVVQKQPRPMIRIALRYLGEEQPMIQGIERVSRPGRRVYVGSQDVRPIQGGIGVTILSTSQGLMTDRQSKKRRVGGEVLCRVW